MRALVTARRGSAPPSSSPARPAPRAHRAHPAGRGAARARRQRAASRRRASSRARPARASASRQGRRRRACSSGARALLAAHGVPVDGALAEEGRKLASPRPLPRLGGPRRAAASASSAWRMRCAPTRARRWRACAPSASAVSLVSGDHEQAVRLAAAAAGIDELRAGALPEDKLAAVRAARAAGPPRARRRRRAERRRRARGRRRRRRDGARRRGLAPRGRRRDPLAAPRRPRRPRASSRAPPSRRIRENLALALVYNAVAVPLAVLGVLEPLPAAIAMSLSSLAVTGNAIRLLRWRPAA